MLTRNRMFSYHSPRLRFIETPTPPEGTPGVDGTQPEGTEPSGDIPANNEHGFPPETPLAKMTVEQREAYWKHHSRRHETVAESRADYDIRKDESEKYRAYLQSQKTPEQIATEEAQRQAEHTAATTLLPIAVGALLEARTGKPKAEIDSALAFIDVTKFTAAGGGIDDAKIDAFAATIGKKVEPDPTIPPTDPVKEQLERQRNDANARGGGSIRELTSQALESLIPTPKQ